MLTEIGLENFKCFGRLTTIPLARVSVFIGPNGSGKSTPIQALMLLKQSLGKASLETSGALIRLGGFRDVVHRSVEEGVISLKLAATSDFGHQVPELPHEVVKWEYTLVTGPEGLRSHRVVLGLDGINLEAFYDRQTDAHALSHDKLAFPQASIKLRRGEEIGTALRSPSATFSSPEARRLNEAFVRFLATPRESMGHVYSVLPLERGFAEPSYELAGGSSLHFDEVQSGARAQAVATTLKYREDELEERLSQWYERVTGIRIRFALREGRTTFLESVTPHGSFNIVNEGFGSNQLAFVLGQLAIAPAGATVAVEEPEVHLHPKAQYELANVLREVALEEEKQLIITTHSEHILFSLLTAVASGQLDVADLAINYFENRKGVAEVRRLEVDDKGRVKGGLPGFFEADLDQMDRYIGALSES